MAQDRLSIDAEKKSKSSPPASSSQARANNPPSRPLRARPTLPMHSRRATGAGMQSGASAPKTRRLTANTRQNNTHRGTGECEASSWRGKPGIPAPGGGQGSGWTRLCASYSPCAPRNPPPTRTVPCHRSCISIAAGYTQAALCRVILRMYRVTEVRSSRKCSDK